MGDTSLGLTTGGSPSGTNTFGIFLIRENVDNYLDALRLVDDEEIAKSARIRNVYSVDLKILGEAETTDVNGAILVVTICRGCEMVLPADVGVDLDVTTRLGGGEQTEMFPAYRAGFGRPATIVIREWLNSEDSGRICVLRAPKLLALETPRMIHEGGAYDRFTIVCEKALPFKEVYELTKK